MSGLDGVFKSFTHDAPAMDGRTFVKLCKDCKVFDKNYTTTDADLVFTKVKAKGAKTITFAEFEAAIGLIAEKKKVSAQELSAQISSASGPVYSGTKALPNKFHDDKSLYTGVHANGGPSTVDGNINDISQILDRSAATVRGTKM
ncbi:tubulin polymerization-promoting protein family member 3, related [Neospora caninum Liverpool]|uniref:Tubulin polymerization-promoting protein family member 3, related n=1 Tax=Neospora caninum (strain Liverpool) TaxID=572307 RepID=F0VA13_NEOCL|nr:tubulin polymerization-promoting protein family member 3, related [Neospora caninum Liverpool]CBZ50502.1 tubulin polymerization-promoting protein family member 3, related [Neospora caninum Liverpool]CEL65112.1 TPA: Tubulin polymerization-promoting protein family member 3, related [Neospora caninum Liverpool]|eukprot:XP_003880535.1 tubulin polymerization-promoting protein family member 3, related [Neospora caninum Liverpool]